MIAILRLALAWLTNNWKMVAGAAAIGYVAYLYIAVRDDRETIKTQKEQIAALSDANLAFKQEADKTNQVIQQLKAANAQRARLAAVAIQNASASSQARDSAIAKILAEPVSGGDCQNANRTLNEAMEAFRP